MEQTEPRSNVTGPSFDHNNLDSTEFNEEIQHFMTVQPKKPYSFTAVLELMAPELFHHSPESNDNASYSSEEVEKLPYVHVRARRGQATDSHIWAERAGREKIKAFSMLTRERDGERTKVKIERINVLKKLLPEPVPGCTKAKIERSNVLKKLLPEPVPGCNKDDETVPIVESSGTEASYRIDIGVDNSIGDHKRHGRTNTVWSSRKVD